MKFLIVDDEEGIRNVLQAMLKAGGHEVDIEGTGRDAFRQAIRSDYDAIFLDVMMPDWNGVEAIKGLDMLEEHPAIVIVSGFIDDDLRHDLEGLKIHAWLTKPFDNEKVDEIVQSLA